MLHYLENMHNFCKEKQKILIICMEKIPESVYQQDVGHRQDEEQSQL